MLKFFLKLRRENNGVAAIEFALVLPVLLTMMLGTIEAGLLFQLKNSMTFHTRAITREIALGTLEASSAEVELRSRLSSYADLTYVVSVDDANDNDSSDNDVIVTTVTSQASLEKYALTGWLVWSDISITATMRSVR